MQKLFMSRAQGHFCAAEICPRLRSSLPTSPRFLSQLCQGCGVTEIKSINFLVPQQCRAYISWGGEAESSFCRFVKCLKIPRRGSREMQRALVFCDLRDRKSLWSVQRHLTFGLRAELCWQGPYSAAHSPKDAEHKTPRWKSQGLSQNSRAQPFPLGKHQGSLNAEFSAMVPVPDSSPTAGVAGGIPKWKITILASPGTQAKLWLCSTARTEEGQTLNSSRTGILPFPSFQEHFQQGEIHVYTWLSWEKLELLHTPEPGTWKS